MTSYAISIGLITIVVDVENGHKRVEENEKSEDDYKEKELLENERTIMELRPR